MASQSNEDKSKITFEEWIQGSISYPCVLCQMGCPDVGSFLKHLENVHKMNYNQYVELFGKPRKVIQITCQICGEELDHEHDSLKRHIQENHKFPLPVYFEKFIDGPHKKTVFPNQGQDDSDNDGEVVFLGTNDLTRQDSIRENIESEQGSEAQNSCSDIVVIVVESDEPTLATTSSALEPITLDPGIIYVVSGQNDATANDPKSSQEPQELTTQPTTNLELGSTDLQPPTEADGQPSNGSSSMTNGNLPLNNETSLMANQLAHCADEQSDECFEEATENKNDWIDKCIFKCHFCNDVAAKYSKGKLRVHLNSHHKSESKGYFGRYGDETYVQKAYHVCQICLKSCLWTQESVYYHLKKSHKIKPDFYRSKYMSKYSEVESEILEMRKQEQELQKIQKSKRNSASEAAPKSSATSSQVGSPDEVSDVLKWARGCLYECEVCDKAFAGSTVFKHHLETDHSMSVSYYKEVFRLIRVFKRHHVCMICNVNIIHDRKELKIHFRNEHDMSVTKYFNDFKDVLPMPSPLPSKPEAESSKRHGLRIRRKQTCYYPAEKSENESKKSAKKSHLPCIIKRKCSVKQKEGEDIVEAKKSKPDM